MPSVFQRHFAFKHPLFNTKRSAAGVWWEESVYYLWWEFLRRHEGYRRTCENEGKGKFTKLYDNFGNVRGVSFKDWWTKGDRGAKLFAEPPLPNSLAAIGYDEVERLRKPWTRGSLMVVVVPLNLRKRFILNRFNKLLSTHHNRKRGQRTFRESRALYPIATSFNVYSLKKTLEVFDLRQKQRHLTLWQIAQQLKLGTPLTKEELSRGKGVNKKSVLSVAASKKLKLARQIIDGVGRGIFPAISTRESGGK